MKDRETGTLPKQMTFSILSPTESARNLIIPGLSQKKTIPNSTAQNGSRKLVVAGGVRHDRRNAIRETRSTILVRSHSRG